MVKNSEEVNLDGLHQDMREFIHRLEKKIGRELTISSGYRGPEHPLERSKSAPGAHSTGLAIDVVCLIPFEFIELVGEAYRLGCRRIGVNRKKNFVHLDLCNEAHDKYPSLWTY